MSTKDYDVNPERLETIDYKILVLTLPEEDLEDLLTHFVSERGSISESLYEDFLIANGIANLNQFMAHIQSVSLTGELDLVKLRKEIVGLIVKHNPKLDSNNIIINSNKVLKLKTKENEKDSIPLIENVYWNKSYYDEHGNYKPISKKEGSNHMNRPNKKGKDVAKKDINELDWEPQQIFWSRLNEYVTVKRFSIEDIDQLLSQRYFHNSTSFNTYIVQNCIVDVEEIYERIDGMGVNVDPNKVIRELFQLCTNINETISYKRAKDLHPSEDDGDDNVNTPGTRKASFTKSGYGPKKKKKNKPSFKQVPKEELMKLADNMKVSLVGQDKAIDKLCEAIKRASVGLKDPVKPIGSFLFAGRTGVGKTLASKVLANELIKTKKNRIVIDCSEYSNDHEYAKLIGAPAGYIGHDNGGILTNAIAEDPFSVVVFDEIEKASTKVFDLLLQILDEGRLTDGRGMTVSFKDTVVLMTSNIGVKEVDDVTKTIGFGDVAVLTEEKKDKALDKALKNKFKPEFLNRIDSIVHFKNLGKKEYMRIIDIELYKLVDYLKANDTEYKDITLTFDSKLKDFIYKNGVDEKYGARPIKRAIEKYVSNEIAGALLEEEHSPFAEINVTIKRGKVVLDIIDKGEETSLLVHADKV